MRSGGPWNLRGLRPEARETARDAARQSGVSVGEWLNSIIKSKDEAGERSPPASRQNRARNEYPRRQPQRAQADSRDHVVIDEMLRPNERHSLGEAYGGNHAGQSCDPLDSGVPPLLNGRPRGGGPAPASSSVPAFAGDDEAAPGIDGSAHERQRETTRAREQLREAGRALEELREAARARERAREAARQEILRDAARQEQLREAARQEELREAERVREELRETAQREALREAAHQEQLREAARLEELREAARAREELREAAQREALREAAHQEQLREAALQEELREAERAAEALRETARREALREAAHQEALRRAAQEEQLPAAAGRKQPGATPPAPDDRGAPAEDTSALTAQGLGAVHARLDTLSQQLERLAELAKRPSPESNGPSPPPLPQTAMPTRQSASLASAAEPSEERAPRLTGAPPHRRRMLSEALPSRSESVASERNSPFAAGGEPSIEEAIAEIIARQRMLDAVPIAASAGSARAAPPFAAMAPGAQAAAAAAPLDLNGLELQLRQITMRIDALRPSGDIEQAISGLRANLHEVSRRITEAMPRRAVESLELEVEALADRIDHSRQSGVDATELAELERGLTEVRQALGALTPAESLVGFDEAVNALAQKVDLIIAKDDPAALQQLEAAVGGLCGVVSHVASNDALAEVADDVRALAVRVDGLANNAATGGDVSVLSKRIETLVAALNASAEAGHAVPRELEKLFAGLIDKLEWVQLTHTDHAVLAHLEDRIAALVSRFDASDARLGQLEAIERGLADLLVYLERLHGPDGKVPGGAAPMPSLDPAAPDDAENKQSERPIQATVDQLIDRLATIDGEVRRDDVARAPSAAAVTPQLLARLEVALAPPQASASATPPPLAGAVFEDLSAPARPELATVRSPARPPIDPSLPPDHPLEPGSTERSRPTQSAAARIAASEAALAYSKPPAIPEGGKPNFIAAARRAAQAAAQADGTAESAAGGTAQPNQLSERLRKLAVAAGAVLIVFGCVHVAVRYFDKGNASVAPPPPSQQVPPPTAPPPPAHPIKQGPTDNAPSPPPAVAPPSTPAAAPAPAATPSAIPGMTTRDAKPSVQSSSAGPASPVATTTPPADEKRVTFATPTMPAWAMSEVTGTLPAPARPQTAATGPAAAAAAADDKLPATIGDPALRAAATAGNPAAAYEVGVRFADGRGVPQNSQEAARWLERAAKQGLAPAQFRLGGLYEKGTGVKKDLVAARDLYLAAAEKGNGKAMHNLAVLYAEGINGPPDYTSAAHWFRAAADRGVADSQYNLGILYARGIGVEQNYAESYKWFALAAKQGDKEAGKKRDELATHLDPQALAGAQLAVQAWKAEPQPDEAINVKMAAAWEPIASAPHPAAPKPRPPGAKDAPGDGKAQ